MENPGLSLTALDNFANLLDITKSLFRNTEEIFVVFHNGSALFLIPDGINLLSIFSDWMKARYVLSIKNLSNVKQVKNIIAEIRGIETNVYAVVQSENIGYQWF